MKHRRPQLWTRRGADTNKSPDWPPLYTKIRGWALGLLPAIFPASSSSTSFFAAGRCLETGLLPGIPCRPPLLGPFSKASTRRCNWSMTDSCRRIIATSSFRLAPLRSSFFITRLV